MFIDRCQRLKQANKTCRTAPEPCASTIQPPSQQAAAWPLGSSSDTIKQPFMCLQTFLHQTCPPLGQVVFPGRLRRVDQAVVQRSGHTRREVRVPPHGWPAAANEAGPLQNRSAPASVTRPLTTLAAASYARSNHRGNRLAKRPIPGSAGPPGLLQPVVFVLMRGRLGSLLEFHTSEKSPSKLGSNN